MVLFKCSIGCQNWVAAPGSTSRAAAAVVKNPPWPGQHKYSEMSTHCAVCLRGLYEVSPELLERNLSDVAASLMLEDSCAFGVYFDFISEPHTDLLSLPPKIVFDDHGVQKQSFALSKLWANWICISVHIYVGLAGAFLVSLLLLPSGRHFVLHICLKRAMINELYLDLNRIMYILVHRHLDCILNPSFWTTVQKDVSGDGGFWQEQTIYTWWCVCGLYSSISAFSWWLQLRTRN